MTLAHIAADAALFCVGFGASEAIRWFRSRPRPPKPPRCTAVLRSGEGCTGSLGHTGPHRTRIDLTGRGMFYQDYVWEDPNAGVYSVGFFHAGGRR